MRPVDKGDAPAVYARYQDAGPDLRARLGDYCSYCERQIETNLAVEHVQPKSVVPALTTEWTNFLLACTNCNSTKGFSPVVIEDYFWPDADNTLRAFEYLPGGLIEPNPELSRTDATKAAATLELTGLDRYPGRPAQEPTKSDQRWSRRRDTSQLATKHCKRLAVQDTAVVRELIVENALARGMFSIWWTVFSGDVDMRRRLREAFIGTHTASFDINENPVPRVGGQL